VINDNYEANLFCDLSMTELMRDCSQVVADIPNYNVSYMRNILD